MLMLVQRNNLSRRGCAFWTRRGPNVMLTFSISHHRTWFIKLTLKACDRLAVSLLALTGGKVRRRELTRRSRSADDINL